MVKLVGSYATNAVLNTLSLTNSESAVSSRRNLPWNNNNYKILASTHKVGEARRMETHKEVVRPSLRHAAPLSCYLIKGCQTWWFYREDHLALFHPLANYSLQVALHIPVKNQRFWWWLQHPMEQMFVIMFTPFDLVDVTSFAVEYSKVTPTAFELSSSTGF